MNAKLVLFSVLMTFAPAALMGCAAADSGSESAPEAVGTTQDALAAGIQTVHLYASTLGLGAAQGQDSASPVATFKFANGNIKFNTFSGTLTEVNVTSPRAVNLSKDVADVAVLLKLGAFKSFDAGAGSGYYVFASGSQIRVSLENGGVTEVAFANGQKTVAGAAVLAAAHSRIGTFVRTTDSGDSRTVTFSAGAVKYNWKTGAIDDVTLTGIAGATQNAAARLGLGAYVRGTHERGLDHDTYAKGTVNYDTVHGKIVDVEVPGTRLSAAVVDLASNLNLGAYVDTDGGMESATANFVNGKIFHAKFEDKVFSVSVKYAGQLSEIPLSVAQAAASNAFGTVTGIEGAAGSAYYSFADGLVQWSNVSEKLVAVTLK